MSNQPIECKFCYQDFNTKKERNRHLTNRPSRCVRAERRFKEEKEKELKAKENEMKAKLEEKDKEHKMVVDQLIYSKFDVRTRKKLVNDVKSRVKIPSFRSVFENANYTLKELKEYIRLDAEGDVMIFKDLFIDKPEPEARSIRIRDYARDKYEIFDGNQWVTMKLRQIVGEIMMDSLAELYRPVIDEKHNLLNQVDEKYPRYVSEEMMQKNMHAYNDTTDMYASATEHFASLRSNKESLQNDIKNGIQGLLLKSKN